MRIDDLIGRPYQRGGRGPEVYDCAGLVVEVMRRRGIELSIPDSPPDYHDMLASMREILRAQWVDVPQPFPGCLVYFRPGHVGVMLTPNRFIHTTEQAGQVCIERLEGPVWPRAFRGFYEYGGPAQ